MHESKVIADEKKKRQEKGTQIDNMFNDSKYVQTESENSKPNVKVFQPVPVNKPGSESIFEQVNEKPKPALAQCRLLLEILFPHPSHFNQSQWPEKKILEKYKANLEIIIVRTVSLRTFLTNL